MFVIKEEQKKEKTWNILYKIFIATKHCFLITLSQKKDFCTNFTKTDKNLSDLNFLKHKEKQS